MYMRLLRKEKAFDQTFFFMLFQKSIPDSDEVNALKEKIDKVRKEIDDIIEEEHRMIKENRMLEDKMEEQDTKINQ